MKIVISLDEVSYQISSDSPVSAAIPLEFSGAQPNHYGAERATRSPMEVGSFIGDTEQGGSCNVNILNFNPHCNGTHTESIAHICDQSAELSKPIGNINLPPVMPCVLVSIKPENGVASKESYSPPLAEHDQMITRNKLKAALSAYSDSQLQCVALRSLPNTSNKKTARYDDDNQPPFLSCDAISYLNERGTEHLLVDLPSIDRLHDDGQLTCHHQFWQVNEHQHQATQSSLINKTITELAFFDEQLADGFYFLNLQLTAMINDATPSKPVMYFAEITDVKSSAREK